MKVALATVFYQKINEVKRLVESVPKGVVDYWLAIDGPYRYIVEKYNTPPKSHLACRTVFTNKTGVDVRLYDNPGVTEYQKRQFYLELCSSESFDIDVLIIIDSDEYFLYPPGSDPFLIWREFIFNISRARQDNIKNYSDHNVFNIAFQDEGIKSYKPRIWLNPGEMRYLGGSHYHFGNVKREINKIKHYESFGSIYNQAAITEIPGMNIAHSHDLRHNDYKKRDKDYRDYITRYEELIQTTEPGGKKLTASIAHDLASI